MAYDVAITIGLQTISFLFIYLASSLKENKNIPFKILFIFVALFISLTNLDIMSKIAVTASQTMISDILISSYSALMYSMILFLAYIIILFVWEAFNKYHKM